MRKRKISEFLSPVDKIIFNRDDLLVPSEQHEHEFVEIEYVLAGCGTQIINGKEYPMKRGDIILIELGVQHSYYSESELEIFNCIINPELYYELKRQIVLDYPEYKNSDLPVYMSLAPKHFNKVESLLLSMEHEFQEKDFYFEKMIESYFNTLLLIIFRNAKNENIQNNNSEQLQIKFENYIDKNYVNLKLSDISRYFGYSTAYFSRLFKQVMGQNLSDYVTEKKLNEAIRLLTETPFSIEVIGTQLGYKNRKQFHEMFNKHMKTTPKQYRIKHKNKNKKSLN